MPEIVHAVFTLADYSPAMWRRTLLLHNRAGDQEGVLRALELMKTINQDIRQVLGYDRDHELMENVNIRLAFTVAMIVICECCESSDDED